MDNRIGKSQSLRQLRVGEQIKQFLNETFIKGSFNDRDLKKAIISINEVKITADLKIAMAYVTIVGEKYPHKAIKALNKANAYFKKEMGKQLNLKYIPNIKFIQDDSLKVAEKIDKLFEDISSDTEE